MEKDKPIVFIEIKNGMSVNIKDIAHITTSDMRKFYVIINGSNSCKERYEISKDTYFALKKLGFGKNAKGRKKR